MGTPPSNPAERSIRSGIRVSVASIVWTIAAGGGAIVAGLLGHSLVVIVFGLTGFADAAGSFTLVFHFRHALKHEAMSAARERLALRVVSGGLLAIGLFTIVESTRRLVVGSRAGDSAYGAGIAVASFVALGVLAAWKRAIARTVGSRALGADGLLSAIGAGLAFIAAVGATLAGRRHLSWIDPASSMVLAVIAVSVASGCFAEKKRSSSRRMNPDEGTLHVHCGR